MRTASGPRNRPISTFVATFASLSLVASVLPLLTRGAGEQSFVPVLERGTSFAVYAVFLLLFVFFFLPGALRRESGRSLGPWWALAAFALLFGAVPGVVSAYISGVASPQALCVGGMVAAACAMVILLRAVFGRVAPALTFAIGGLTLFAIPAVEAMCWSTGTRMNLPLGDLSLISWVRRLAFLREPVDPKGVVIVAAALWILVVIVAVKARPVIRAARFGILALPILLSVGEPPPGALPPEVTVKAILGPVARAGARIPVVVTAKGSGGAAELALKTEALRVPADGQPHTALITLAASESEAEVSAGGERVRIPLPFKWIDPSSPAVGILAGGTKGDEIRAALPAAEVVAIDLAIVPRVPGALEVFDAIVVEAAQWDALRPDHRELLRAYASLSGTIVVVGPAGTDTREAGRSRRLIGSVGELGGLNLRRTLDPDPFDPTLKSLFARPDWQALDLTKLMLFLVLYHGAFLVAFLLPLLLDSHKSTAVYLVSVGTVIVIVVAVAWWSLRQFFLRDNQVYTQSLTYVAIGAQEKDAIARQFRCYASMSGERRDFPWPLERDLVDYRDLGPPGRVLDLGGTRRLDDVWLDRFHAKLLVREDLALRAPLGLVSEDGGFRVRPVPDVPDPLGLRAATLTHALVIEEDDSIRSATLQGWRIVIGEKAGTEALGPVPRALRGRFGKPASGRLVIVRATGVNRLDDTTGYFKTTDLEAVLAFDL